MPNDQPITIRERSVPLPSCNLTKDDLLTLYRQLQEKVRQAAELEVLDWERGDDDAEFEKTVNWVKGLFVITVTIVGINGERQIGNNETIFLSPHLPDRIASVYFDSGTLHRVKRNNLNPLNWFYLLIDFTKPPRFDLTNPVSNPTPNTSNVHVTGSDDGWVNSVFQTTMELIKERENEPIRGWLHRSNAYDVLLWFVGIPLTFAVVEKISPRLDGLNLPSIANGALYVYLFLLCLLILRLFFHIQNGCGQKSNLHIPVMHQQSIVGGGGP